MYNYMCRGGPNESVIASSRYPNGFVLTDMPGEVNGDGLAWAWIYDRTEVWADVSDSGRPVLDKDGNQKREMRGFYFVVRDETGEAFDEEKAEIAAASNTYDVIAYDNGEVPGDVEVGL